MKKRTVSLILAVVMLLSLTACGSSAETRVQGAPAEAPAAVATYSYDMAADMAMEEAEYAVEKNGFSASGKAPEDGSAGAEAPEQERYDKIIYSSEATVETTDFDGAQAQVQALMEQYGGWIESSSVTGSKYYNISRGRASSRSAYFTLRVPCEHFDAIMNGLSAMGNVPFTHTYTENVTAQYYDTQARLTAYQTQEARLLEMMELAETVEDVITIEEKLTDLRYRIESLQSTLKNWDRRVSYSTIHLSVEEVQEYTPETVVKPSYGQKLWRAMKDGVTGFVAFMGELLIALVEALPALIVLGLAVWGIVRLVKRRRAKRRAKSSAVQNEENCEK